MNEKVRIGFMGTPEFAVASLSALLEKGYEVPVVVTAPDRPAGRGRKMKSSPVKEFASAKGIPVLQPNKLKDPSFISELGKHRVNLLVVVAFRMLPREVWSLPKYGTFNLHASLLPDYRGAAPINWAIINGETQTGVTTFFIDEQIDTGNILLQESTPIGPEESAGDLHDRLMSLGAALVLDTVQRIQEGNSEATPQQPMDPSRKAPKLNRENSRLSWISSNIEIHNMIRGLNPYPGSWTELVNGDETIQVKVFKSRPIQKSAIGSPGNLNVEDNHLYASTGDGWLELLEIQLPGKRRMSVREVLNGLQLAKGSHFR